MWFILQKSRNWRCLVSYDYNDDYADIKIVNSNKEDLSIILNNPDILGYFLYKYEYIN